jgi:prolipoprotein diacylglyceryltransferase
VHFPVYLTLGPIALHPHWVFESLAYLVGARLYAYFKRRTGDSIDDVDRWWVVAAAFLGAALGSKLIVIVDHPSLSLEHLTEPLAVLDGKSVVGGLIGALIAVEWAKRRLGVTRATGDLFAFPLVIGIAIGRVGCFLSGLEDHTHGLAANVPWAIDFGDGIPRHPAQLYEIAFLLLVLAPALVYVARRPHREGDLFKLFMAGYLGFRVGLEFLKPGEPIFGLTAIQWACVGGLAWYAHYLPLLAKRPRKPVLARG